MNINTHSPEKTQELGKRIGEIALSGDVFLLSGNLGAGKTCFTQGLAWGLGIEGYAMSPTFVIVRELYGRLPLYHIDLYRLDRIEETTDLGLDDYIYGQGVCVIEWAEKALNILPEEHLQIEISYIDATERCLQMKPRGRRYERIVEQLRQIYH